MVLSVSCLLELNIRSKDMSLQVEAIIRLNQKHWEWPVQQFATFLRAEFTDKLSNIKRPGPKWITAEFNGLMVKTNPFTTSS